MYSEAVHTLEAVLCVIQCSSWGRPTTPFNRLSRAHRPTVYNMQNYKPHKNYQRVV